MKDIYFIAGLGLGAIAGMIVMYKSKKAKEIASTCEKGAVKVAEEIKEKVEDKKQKDAKPAKKKSENK